MIMISKKMQLQFVQIAATIKILTKSM